MAIRTSRKTPSIAVLVDTSTGWGRRLIDGIVQFSRQHGPWHLWLEARGQQEYLRPPDGWDGDGIIARVTTEAMARELAALQVPVVNVSGVTFPGPQFPRVTTDPRGSARFAADHFLQRGFRNFAYCGSLRFSHVATHYRAFADAVTQSGGECFPYRPPSGLAGWKAHQEHLSQWLASLPKPLAVLTWGPRGLAVLEACRLADLHVPQQVAVLSGDEDELLWEAATPPLSGIEVPSELIGREAAATLERMLRREPVTSDTILFQPTRVVCRQSTDTLAIDDPELGDAMRYIAQHATEPITVDNVLRNVPLSRRSLERRFQQVFGRSPAEEIRRVRLEKAQQLLLETDQPISDVATHSGFGSPEYMSFAFKAALGMTPLRYRSRLRAR